jgi:hypothetical protein
MKRFVTAHVMTTSVVSKLSEELTILVISLTTYIITPAMN